MVKKIMNETNTGFMSYIGGLSLKKLDTNNFEFSVVVKKIHLNNGKITHGGFLATIADTGMGTAANMLVGNRRCVNTRGQHECGNACMQELACGQANESGKCCATWCVCKLDSETPLVYVW